MTPQRGRGKNILIWILQVVVAIAMIAAGSIKLMGNPEMVLAFDRIGWGHWFLYLTGALEIAGGIGLLIPRVTFYAACLVAAIMACAVVFCLTLLKGQSPYPAIVFFLLAGAVAYYRKP